MWTHLRRALRLFGPLNCVQCQSLFPNPSSQAYVTPVSTPVRRFQELISGQRYQIEVTAVGQGRWRADIVRIPGVPTALMPFYGPTPDEAADHLRQWLTRAHDKASPGKTK